MCPLSQNGIKGNRRRYKSALKDRKGFVNNQGGLFLDMKTTITAAKLIDQLQLQAHPEGGWYRRSYQSEEIINAAALPPRFNGGRHISTAIFYLLENGNFSALHKIKSDEIWYFYMGDPLRIHIIYPSGALSTIILGNDFEKGQHFQFAVPARCWFASKPAPASEFSLVGCTVAPGFDFADFELADVATLKGIYPMHKEIIDRLCR